jgi:hypothetical protein
MVVRLTGMLLMVGALVGIAMLLARFAGQKEAGEWSWNPKSIRTNFDPIYTPAELKKLQQEAAERALAEFGIAVNSPLVDPPRDNRPPANNGLPLPFEERKDQPLPEEARGTDQREIWARRDALHAELAARQFTLEPVFDYTAESHEVLDFVEPADADRTLTMGEFAANGGRQSPPSERLALGVMRKLPRGEQLAARLHRDVYFHGPGQRSIAAYRGRGLAVSGRLFDLYRVTLAQPLVYPDGARVDGYFEGAVAFLGRGVGTEHPIEQRVVLFQCLQLPPELEPYVNTAGVIAQSDKLANEAVMVSLEGAYLRLWVYSRKVAPFSTPGKPVLCQAHAPLMLAAAVTRSPNKPYEITDELLQQVRDALREDPVFLETEAAYYALLARANDPGDSVEAVPDVGYFDLAGGGGETGPRYRGQGIRIVGMIGDDYVPVILPPNIAGMRRVFRTLLLGDTADFATPKKYLLDMVEPPTGLEPRALVAFNARYYRNVFETKSTRSDVRPLLIARRAVAIQEGKKETEWIYVGAGLTAFLGLFVVVIFFVMSDRRERRRFEAASVELSRKRLEKRGGLKLKPLPGDAPAGQEPPKPDPPAAT